eukprot:TRINITY_DN409_c3_g1_i1.p1 TRINITY_DN409_c3_g1~~TRINITY_DN409_c3_g1_i1.p1  ORF type:complete len:165 (-),score=72.75 TRINITY_DN409_c3_g1_i1:61-555(-)
MILIVALPQHVLYRWLATGLLYLIYAVRVYLLQGWYIVTYGLALYLLNLLIGFLSPQVDPDADPDGDGASAALPRTKDDEFRPFVRRLPEFKFWLAASRAVLVALVMTLTALFDVPVFWPILLVYFIVLFLLTMKRQVLHMVRHRYVPFTTGKKVYSAGGKGDK